MISINHTPCHCGNLVSMATRVKLLLFTPRKSQDGLLMFISRKTQNGPRLKVGFFYLPPDIVKKGKVQRWAAVVYSLTESYWQ